MERSVRLAVVEDLLSRRRPDTGQCVELLERRRVEVERRRRRCRAARGGRSTPPGHDHLLAVGEGRSKVDQLDVRPSRRPACDGDCVGDARARLEPVEARAPHRTSDVDDELRLDCTRRPWRTERRHGHSGSAAMQQLRHAEHEYRHDHHRGGEQPSPRGRESTEVHPTSVAAKPLRERQRFVRASRRRC